MKQIVAATSVLALSFLAGGCATKKYVRNTTAPVQARVEQVGETTVKQGQAIDENRNKIQDVDQRAEAGISAAKERAMTAENKANEANTAAGNAMQKANQATEIASKATEEISSLRGVVANLDDYKLQAEASVPFKFNQAKLSDEAKADLDKLVADKGRFKRFFIAVEGYTDKTGSAEYNAQLSKRRADAVVNYLVTKHDIPIYRVHMVGLGSQKPAAEGRGREVNAKNRRVEVKIFSADQASMAMNASGSSAADRSAATGQNYTGAANTQSTTPGATTNQSTTPGATTDQNTTGTTERKQQ